MKKKRIIFTLLLIAIILITGRIIFAYCNEYIDLSKEDDARIAFAMEYESSPVILFVAVDNRGELYYDVIELKDYRGVLRTSDRVLSEKTNQNSEVVTAEEVEHAYQLLLGVNKNGRRERQPKSGHPSGPIRWYGIRYRRFGPREKVLLLDYPYTQEDSVLAGEDAQEIIKWMFKWASPWERNADSPANA